MNFKESFASLLLSASRSFLLAHHRWRIQSKSAQAHGCSNQVVLCFDFQAFSKSGSTIVMGSRGTESDAPAKG